MAGPELSRRSELALLAVISTAAAVTVIAPVLYGVVLAMACVVSAVCAPDGRRLGCAAAAWVPVSAGLVVTAV